MKCIERRLATAILSSALAHALVLSYLQPSWERVPRGSVINASLIQRHDGPSSRIAATDAKPVQALRQAPPQVTSVRDKPPVASPQPGANIRNAADQSRRGLSVLLVIDADGRVGPIHWNQLPPMTEETLRRIEQVLRQKTYPSMGLEYTLIEPVEALIERETPR